jgi:hypothetical protein
MYLGKSLLPAAAAFLKESLHQGADARAGSVDLTKKAALLEWIRARTAAPGSRGPRLQGLPFASLPPELLSDLDVACAVADVEPALLAKFSPAVLTDPGVARRAIAADSCTASMFSDDMLRLLGVPRAPAKEVRAVSEFELAMETVRVRPMALGEFSPAIRNDPEVVELAVRGDPAAFAFASQHLWADPHFITANLPASPDAAARVIGKLVAVHGDGGAANLLSNRHVATLIAPRVTEAALPPRTRAVIEQAHDASRLRRHPLSRPNRPSPFSDS